MKTKIAHVDVLGSPKISSPLIGKPEATFINERENVIYEIHEDELLRRVKAGEEVMFFELAGPRKQIYFSPKKTACGIVTCGGLVPVLMMLSVVSW